MTAESLLRHITEMLESAEIPYMVTGSFASSLHGRPRATQDLDLVIAPSEPKLERLLADISGSQYYVDREAALEALRSRDQFNIIEPATGWKVDLIVKKARPFSQTEFDRRSPAEVQGSRVFVASAEDVLIAKLEWAKRGGSERQIEDAAGILQIRGAEIDRGYVLEWVGQLGLNQQWTAACRMAGLLG